MKDQLEINQGEIKLTFNESHKGKVYLSDLGLKSAGLDLEAGLLRFVIDIKNLDQVHFAAVPTIEFTYTEEMGETHWQCDFNGTMIADKLDHHGHSTVILLKRNGIEELIQRHENTMIVHAEFPKPAVIDPEKSYIALF
ncbi:hypothetical protein [Parvicella tangerina]|uniref:Uncharacterized protein n=1 Tax=Parvicella tangerina TaxID=2829795 RepID=A0A916JKR6_9FLAO|nr:hypothetical protein [Parvicella tangerina]CAG5077408.1 hypothetical protein CRYO30217_00375 [Parvicella tangerina]